MIGIAQGDLFETEDLTQAVEDFMLVLLRTRRRPSAQELVNDLRNQVGLEAARLLPPLLRRLAERRKLTRADRDYCLLILQGNDLESALRNPPPELEARSTIDALVQESRLYRESGAFQEMINFMAGFRDYAPYNNLLVRLQNPSCNFYATARDWRIRFNRELVEDAKPMIILAPMHPVMLVYDLDQTVGPPLPKELETFAQFEGYFDQSWLQRLIENAGRHRIRVDFKPLSSTNAGFAMRESEAKGWKMRIAVHSQLAPPSQFGILCHEIAHVMLGHLGADVDRWWPGRAGLDKASMEIEAEAVAFIVTRRLELTGTSAAYVSRYLSHDQVPLGISIDLIAKTAAFVERMARGKIPEPKRRSEKEKQ
ncbi:hypothetical protein D9623_00400 [Azospirillum brasilense]|uniref:IrrE N-terminal-like domain-containing protein n=1 Tax=Azospirillum brasilense TaxID=192 RepID=A0A0P0EF79_AZOBR|nr:MULTISPECIES: hypothetical protein [Azospirillum]ALJ34254.1 hypothetical protein AMK58_01810 [Azospirillum brasilense]MDW7552757.1 hypothetical protein [Azospirillum brasilense]MDW7592051.1 hypothetical protein [Azospirillum brasilense]MDW7627672.1 hypothetical protein [Azospirillum brasilense]MDX5952859.1 hypothetical protein [Azospirillum brasilense]